MNQLPLFLDKQGISCYTCTSPNEKTCQNLQKKVMCDHGKTMCVTMKTTTTKSLAKDKFLKVTVFQKFCGNTKNDCSTYCTSSALNIGIPDCEVSSTKTCLTVHFHYIGLLYHDVRLLHHDVGELSYYVWELLLFHYVGPLHCYVWLLSYYVEQRFITIGSYARLYCCYYVG